MPQGLHRLKFWGAQHRAAALSGEALEREIKEQGDFDTVQILTGNEATLKSTMNDLLIGFNANAKKLRLNPPPVLFIYNAHHGDADANAVSGKLPDGTKAVGISASVVLALSNDNSSMQALLAGLLATGAHEEGHIFHKAFRPHSPKAQIKQELKEDRKAMEVTCDPETYERVIKAITNYNATQHNLTVDQYTAAELKDPTLDHPIAPTRIAQAEYIKQHLPKGCKKTKIKPSYSGSNP